MDPTEPKPTPEDFAARPNATDEERLAVGWVQQVTCARGQQPSFPVPMPGYEPAPSPAGACRVVAYFVDGVAFMRWLRPVRP